MTQLDDAAPPPTQEAMQEPSEPRPPLGSWNRMYAFVLGFEVLLIFLFHLFTQAFR